jgi:hypothetical protein
MPTSPSDRPVFGQPGWRRRMEARYGWDHEFAAIGAILLLVLISIGFAHGDDASGPLPQDPKEMAPAPQQIPVCYTDQYFLPMPAWSRFTSMPVLPEQLQPMGHGEIKHKPSPAAVAETKPDVPPMPKKLPQVGPLASSATPAPEPANKPELEAISPFLQWVHDHPQEAAAQARQQAASYNAAAPTGATPAGNPYWMPPMLDDAPAAAASGNGSAAIYSTPQK